jgi:flagellar basal-body rod protein FlgB
MDFNNLPILQMMTKKMSWLTRRTEVISRNVANIDTPGYSARDLKSVSFRELIKRESTSAGFEPRRTRVTHMTGLQGHMPYAVEFAPDQYESTIDGNDVSTEQQLTKLSETQTSYQTTLNLYRKHLDMLRLSLGRPGGR